VSIHSNLNNIKKPQAVALLLFEFESVSNGSAALSIAGFSVLAIRQCQIRQLRLLTSTVELVNLCFLQDNKRINNYFAK